MISIIIPTYNRNSILYPILEKIHIELPKDQYEVIVVNDSKTNTVELKEEWKQYMRCFNNPKSGVASARNLGVKQARFNWLLFLDDDMLLSKHNFETYLSWIHKEPNFVLNIDWKYSDETNNELDKSAFGRYLIHIGYNCLRGWNDFPNWKENEIVKVDSIASCNLLIHKSSFENINGYDEQFPFSGAEDFDFSERLKKSGISFYLDLSTHTIHNELDHLSLKKWLFRQYRGGVTKRIAYEKGYKEHFIVDNFKFKLPFFLKPICFSCLSLTRNFKTLDKLSFFCIRALVGQAIYSGFYKK